MGLAADEEIIGGLGRGRASVVVELALRVLTLPTGSVAKSAGRDFFLPPAPTSFNGQLQVHLDLAVLKKCFLVCSD